MAILLLFYFILYCTLAILFVYLFTLTKMTYKSYSVHSEARADRWWWDASERGWCFSLCWSEGPWKTDIPSAVSLFSPSACRRPHTGPSSRHRTRLQCDSAAGRFQTCETPEKWVQNNTEYSAASKKALLGNETSCSPCRLTCPTLLLQMRWSSSCFLIAGDVLSPQDWTLGVRTGCTCSLGTSCNTWPSLSASFKW